MRRNWNRNELILAFSLYCRIPFGKLHSRNPDIIQLANIINRTPSSVALKLVNFSSLDPQLKKKQIKGMSNCSKLDREIFIEFHTNWQQLLIESELLYELYSNIKLNEKQTQKLNLQSQENTEKIVNIKQRINQNYFRKMVLANYNETCAICNLNYSSLLIASHIIPWSKNIAERLNPHNGLCLCSIHDKAFDIGLISLDDQLKVIISNKVSPKNINNFDIYFGNFINKIINYPQKFYPSLFFLEYHRKNIFQKI